VSEVGSESEARPVEEDVTGSEGDTGSEVRVFYDRRAPLRLLCLRCVLPVGVCPSFPGSLSMDSEWEGAGSEDEEGLWKKMALDLKATLGPRPESSAIVYYLFASFAYVASCLLVSVHPDDGFGVGGSRVRR
jgi:hypothetical protein